MKSSHLFNLFAFLALIIGTQSSFTISHPAREKNAKGFAVLELFTSEGCSSCPPADELAAKIQKEMAGQEVYVLTYHVDYWDRLGWKDNFSSADFSNRQRQYGSWLNVSPVYTPQVVVNGKAQFVGSDAAAIRRAILEQLEAKPVATLTMQASLEGEGLKLKYQTGPALHDSRLLVAIIQKAAQTKVLRGENAGHILDHIQIVRKLQSEPRVSAEGTAIVNLPKDFNAQSWEILGLVQDQRNGEILAVTKVSL